MANGHWMIGAYSNDGGGGFSHCAALASYQTADCYLMIAPNRPAIQFDSMIWSCSHCVLPLLTPAVFITLNGEFRSAGGESKDVGFLSKNTESAAGAHAGQIRCDAAVPSDHGLPMGFTESITLAG